MSQNEYFIDKSPNVIRIEPDKSSGVNPMLSSNKFNALTFKGYVYLPHLHFLFRDHFDCSFVFILALSKLLFEGDLDFNCNSGFLFTLSILLFGEKYIVPMFLAKIHST